MNTFNTEFAQFYFKLYKAFSSLIMESTNLGKYSFRNIKQTKDLNSTLKNLVSFEILMEEVECW